MKQGINSRRTGNLLTRAGNLQRLAGKCPLASVSGRQFLAFRFFGGEFRRRSLLAIFRFPFRYGGDRFDFSRRLVVMAPEEAAVGDRWMRGNGVRSVIQVQQH
jgi:hypothetical protein